MVLSSEPDYTKSQHFFLGGLISSSPSMDTAQVCSSKEVIQVQIQRTFWDGLWSFLSATAGSMLGAYIGGLAFSYRVDRCERMCQKHHCHCGNAIGAMPETFIGILTGAIVGSYAFKKITTKVWCAPEIPQQSFTPNFRNIVKEDIP